MTEKQIKNKFFNLASEQEVKKILEIMAWIMGSAVIGLAIYGLITSLI